MFNPAGTDTEKEWIEIFNGSGNIQDLTGWTIKPRGASGLKNYVFPTFSLNSSSFVTIHLRQAGADNETDLFQGSLPTGNMSNTQGSVSLYDNSGTIFDFIEYGAAGQTFESEAIKNNLWPSGDFVPNVSEEKSLELKKDGEDTNSSLDWQESEDVGGTPGQKNYTEPAPLPDPMPEPEPEPDPKPEPEPIPEPAPDPAPQPKIYSKNIRINELFPDPTESPEKKFEYIELYNFDDTPIDLSGWVLKNKNNQATLSGNIEAHAYLSLQDKLTLHNDGDTIALFDPNGEEIFSINYVEEDILPGYSYNFSDSGWKWSSILTPEKENEFDPPPSPEPAPGPDPAPALEPKTYSDKIFLNEILPNPSGDEKAGEFIELYNPEESNIDLSNWILRDGSKTGKYVFPENSAIETDGYLAVYRTDFKFALNNSGAESVTLYSPDDKTVSAVSYTSAKENVSYNFDGNNWHWSKFLTPDAENIFNNPPQSKNKIPETAYVNMYTYFSAKGSDKDKDKLKYIWDFGDGHKSYLPDTRHKYTKTGKYTVTLKIFDGSEDKIQTFKIEVKKFPKLSVKITGLSPNPKGKDIDSEWITIKNNSKKKINLNGWSIATGSKKLYNHPITEDLFIKSGKEIKLTRAYSKFTLNNKSSKVELRYPTGKVAAEVKYKSDKSIVEDTLYAKTNSGWQWQAPKFITVETVPLNVVPQIETPITEPAPQPPAEIDVNIGKYSESPEWKNKKETRFSLLNYGLGIKTASAFSGTETVYPDYFSAKNYPARKHWAVKLLENIKQKINITLNSFFLKLAK